MQLIIDPKMKGAPVAALLFKDSKNETPNVESAEVLLPLCLTDLCQVAGAPPPYYYPP